METPETPHPASTFPNAPDLIARNAEYATNFDGSAVPGRPGRSLAIVTCMDSRLDLHVMLGVDNGEAHIIRNAGGVVTDDTIRSLCLSQRALGTREILLVHHTRCGLHQLDEQEFKAELLADVGVEPTWAVGSFDDPYEDVRRSVELLEASPFIPHTDHVSGFVYDVDTGLLNLV